MRKPRNQTLIQLRQQQPNCCVDCPLCGMIPKDYEKPKWSKETFVCCATWDALTGEGIKKKASECDAKHPLRRPCDGLWDKWAKLPEMKFAVPDEAYLTYIHPFRTKFLQFRIKFHKR